MGMLGRYVPKNRLCKPVGIYRSQKYPIPNVGISSTERWNRYCAARGATSGAEKWLAKVIRVRKRMILQ